MAEMENNYTVIDISNLANLKESQISYRTQNTDINHSYSDIQYNTNNTNNTNDNETNGLVMNIYNFIRRYIPIISRIGNTDNTYNV